MVFPALNCLTRICTGGDQMESLNLLLTFKIAGAKHVRVKGASRIKIDGCGGLTVYGAQNGVAERISLRQLQSLSIQPLGVTSQIPAVYVA